MALFGDHRTPAERKRDDEFAKYTLCGVPPVVLLPWDEVFSNVLYPDALLIVWRMHGIEMGHFPHCMLLDDQHAGMLTHLKESVNVAPAPEMRPPRDLITITGENRDATMQAVITTMQLLHSLPQQQTLVNGELYA